jgi:hypothetical protein
MVHALEEIRRVLVLEGDLIDLRPLPDQRSVELNLGRSWQEIGCLTNLPVETTDAEAADTALQTAARQGWFFRESKRTFPFFFYWSTPEEMRQYIKEEWGDFTVMQDDLYSAVQSAWEAAGPDQRVRVRIKMLLARWQKG